MKKTKGYMAGGKARMSTKMMANGGLTGALKKDMSMSKGMAKGGKTKAKGMAKGGKTKGMANGGKTVARGSGAARTQYFGKNG
jgi:hypothetical protein|tara:strand:- start:1192 stop:1440 length:249 start_codon:yes stop_codon:yes gene_type:complete